MTKHNKITQQHIIPFNTFKKKKKKKLIKNSNNIYNIMSVMLK